MMFLCVNLPEPLRVIVLRGTASSTNPFGPCQHACTVSVQVSTCSQHTITHTHTVNIQPLHCFVSEVVGGHQQISDYENIIAAANVPLPHKTGETTCVDCVSVYVACMLTHVACLLNLWLQPTRQPFPTARLTACQTISTHTIRARHAKTSFDWCRAHATRYGCVFALRVTIVVLSGVCS
jgi:hypothetical protein